jgi:hypothetical protein
LKLIESTQTTAQLVQALLLVQLPALLHTPAALPHLQLGRQVRSLDLMQALTPTPGKIFHV